MMMPIKQFSVTQKLQQLVGESDLRKNKEAPSPEMLFSIPWGHHVQIIMGISEYELAKLYPVDLKSTLPSIEEIEREIDSKGAGK